MSNYQGVINKILWAIIDCFLADLRCDKPRTRHGSLGVNKSEDNQLATKQLKVLCRHQRESTALLTE